MSAHPIECPASDPETDPELYPCTCPDEGAELNLNQRISDRGQLLVLAALTSAIRASLLSGNGVELLDQLDALTEASIALRTRVANQLGA